MCDTPDVASRTRWQGWSELPTRSAPRISGDWIDLTYPLSPSVPRSPMFGPPKFDRIAKLPDQLANITHMDMVVHTGTHVDSPLHFCADAPGMDAVPIDRLTGEGVVIRLELSPCEAIKAEHLASASPTIQRGDIVAIETGWASRWETPDWTRHPYISSEATEWLIEKGVKLIAVDTINPDLPPDLRPDDFAFPVHCSLLSRGILIAEQVANLEVLGGKRAEFFFGALSIRDCDGAPTRVVARAIE